MTLGILGGENVEKHLREKVCINPHVLELDTPGRGAFLAYQTLLSVRANAAAQARTLPPLM